MSGCEDGGTRSAMLRASFFDLTGIAVLGIVRRMALVLRIYYGFDKYLRGNGGMDKDNMVSKLSWDKTVYLSIETKTTVDCRVYWLAREK